MDSIGERLEYPARSILGAVTSSGVSDNSNAWNPKPLSCISCRQRKVKCNKVSPCSACQRSNIECVFPKRMRVPRGRQGRGVSASSRDDELMRRLKNLEALVGKAGGHQTNVIPPSTTDISNVAAVPTNDVTVEVNNDSYDTVNSNESPGSAAKYLGSNFWTRLGNEVDGLKTLLEQPSDDDDEYSESPLSSGNDTNHSSPVDFVFHSTTGGSQYVVSQPSPALSTALFNIYFANVDPVFKVLHKPSLFSSLLKTMPAPDRASNGLLTQQELSFEALLFSMHFAAVTSLSNDQCLIQFGQEKHILQAEYKASTESAFSKADVVNTKELVTLQALIIYLLALRAYSKNQASYTLFAIAVRIAHSLGIHRDGDGQSFSPFEAQMRRRAWWHLIMLDTRGSEDRGCDPLIAEGSFNTFLPANINDSDFGPDSNQPILDAVGCTEMTFSLISQNASNLIQRMNYVPPTNNFDGIVRDFDLQRKIELIKEYSNRFETLYAPYCNSSTPIFWIVLMIGRMLILRLWLILRYPIQRQPSALAVPITPEEALRMAVSNLEISDLMQTTPNAGNFSWFFATYVQWHPLAVALAELCKQTEGPVVEKAWIAVDKAFALWGDRVADARTGMLWRPIKKLLRKAQDARQKAQTEKSNQVQPPVVLDSELSLRVPYLNLQPKGKDVYDPMLLTAASAGMDVKATDYFQNFNGLQWTPISEEPSGPGNWEDWTSFLMDDGADDSLMDVDLKQWPVGSQK